MTASVWLSIRLISRKNGECKKRLNGLRQGPPHVSLQRIYQSLYFINSTKNTYCRSPKLNWMYICENLHIPSVAVKSRIFNQIASEPFKRRSHLTYTSLLPLWATLILGTVADVSLHLREERPTKQRVRAFPWRVLVTPRQTSVIIVVFAESVHACQYRCSINEFGPSSTNYLTCRTVYVSHPIPTHRLWWCVSAGGLNHQSSIIISEAHW